MSWVLVIDVGTSACAAATSTSSSPPTLVPFDGSPSMPSSVLLGDRGQLLVGVDARRHMASSPERLERSPKRRLGDTVILLGGQPVDPVDAVAALLAHVRTVAVDLRGSPPDALRLTYPARWGRARLERLAEAARRAGLPEPVLIPEPVAAAIFATDPAVGVGDLVGVYDLGGGTLDTAVLRRTEEGFDVVGSPGGDDQLGGEHMDDLLFEHVGARIGERHVESWEQLRFSEERPWRRAAHDLRVEVQHAKEALSSTAEYVIYLGAPVDAEVHVSRDELERLITPLVTASVDEMAATVRRAGLAASDLTRLYVVGGASRTPLVTRALAAKLATMPTTWGDPKAAVVLGAAHPDALGTLSPVISSAAPQESTPEPAGPAESSPTEPDDELHPEGDPEPSDERVAPPLDESPPEAPEPVVTPGPGPPVGVVPAERVVTATSTPMSAAGPVPTADGPEPLDGPEPSDGESVNMVALVITAVCVVVAILLLAILLAEFA